VSENIQTEARIVEKAVSDLKTVLQVQQLSKDNLHAFTCYQSLLMLKGYSRLTIRTYCGEFYQLLRLLKEKSAATLTKGKVQGYLLWLSKK
jgi:hypothetical protein